MKNYLNYLIKNKDLKISMGISIIVIAAILIVMFTPFKQIPFVYNEF